MSKIREILNDKESVLVFDIDGVLALFEWGEHNHYGDDDETWSKMYEKGGNYYTEKFVIKKMQNFLKDRDKSRIYVITKAFNDNEAEDKKYFANNFYGIPKEHVFYVKNNIDKTKVLCDIKNEYKEIPDYKLVMIDDTVEVLTHVMENTGFSTVHISSFLD